MTRVLLALCLALAGCVTPAGGPTSVGGEVTSTGELLLSGQTMGSAWTVKIARAARQDEAALRDGIQARFDAVNQALSTWRDDSALMRFNARDDGEWVDIDPELAAVLRYALSLGADSGGAYDVTVGPLVNLWGFGPDPQTWKVPDAAAIEAARAHVGWRKVEVDPVRDRARKAPGVRVDLSSLGKGRGVDRVAEWLDARGVTSYLIDLSGKLRARGVNARGAPWRVAVERPGPDQAIVGGIVEHAVVTLRDQSIATAGDYRRFFESGGKHYSHIIDPATGSPVTHQTVSATALAADCMHADALATVFMAMPPDAALRLANERAVPALLIGRAADRLLARPSTSWRAQ
ncbi:MAG TPA: FAD:protein FMN transferase [Steroidobacteraceae bacterium]|nr:FAD:protein FMN transferase [Steroidobacteraceae bacterium]